MKQVSGAFKKDKKKLVSEVDKGGSASARECSEELVREVSEGH